MRNDDLRCENIKKAFYGHQPNAAMMRLLEDSSKN